MQGNQDDTSFNQYDSFASSSVMFQSALEFYQLEESTSNSKMILERSTSSQSQAKRQQPALGAR